MKFRLADGSSTDLVALSLPVFFVRTVPDFLGLMAARVPDPATGENRFAFAVNGQGDGFLTIAKISLQTRAKGYDTDADVWRAVQQSDKGPFVFVSGPDLKAKRSPVSILANIGDTAVIGAGVKPGDHVVIDGQLHLADGGPVKETLSSQLKVASNAAGAVQAITATPKAPGTTATSATSQ